MPDDVDLHLAVIRGPAGRVLVDSADHPDDLLIVGRGDRGCLHRAINGSVSRYCALRAGCQVLVVPPPSLLRHTRRRHIRTWSHNE